MPWPEGGIKYLMLTRWHVLEYLRVNNGANQPVLTRDISRNFGCIRGKDYQRVLNLLGELHHQKILRKTSFGYHVGWSIAPKTMYLITTYDLDGFLDPRNPYIARRLDEYDDDMVSLKFPNKKLELSI